jgi:hypothetical protein
LFFPTTEGESMPIQFEYIDEIHCLHIVAKGKVSLQEFFEFHRSITITTPPPTLLILSDHRELDPSGLTASDIESIKADALSRTEYKYGVVRQAFVVSDSLTFGLSRMYDGLVYSEKYQVHVFTDINEAKSWLGLEAETCLGSHQNNSAFPDVHPPRTLPD